MNKIGSSRDGSKEAARFSSLGCVFAPFAQPIPMMRLGGLMEKVILQEVKMMYYNEPKNGEFVITESINFWKLKELKEAKVNIGELTTLKLVVAR